MPTPLAHGLAGIAIGRTVRTGWRAWHFAVLAFAITLVPDLDFVPGVLVGEPGLFHRGATHSLFGAAVLSMPIAMLLAALVPTPGSHGPGERFLRWYGFVLPVYSAHLFLDLLSPDTVHNSGLRILWPMTDALYMAAIPVPDAMRGFFDLEFGPDSAGFFRTLFSGHALAVYVAEALLFSPVLVLPWVAARLAKRGHGDGRPGGRRQPVSAVPVERATGAASTGEPAGRMRRRGQPSPADVTG
jgi:inner membrane protein